MISLIVAMGKNNEIGLNNDMPWRLPNDLQYFKRQTENNVVIMGRKTYESIGKPLPNRKNIVLTRQNLQLPEGVEVINDIDDIKVISEQYKDKNIFIIGGAQLYKQVINIVDKLFITEINESFEADTYFPQFNRAEWEEVYREQGVQNEKNNHEYTFIQLERIS